MAWVYTCLVFILCLCAHGFADDATLVQSDVPSNTQAVTEQATTADDLSAADHDRRVKLDKARMKMEGHDRRIKSIDSAIAKAKARLEWIRDNPYYYDTVRTRHRCYSCNGTGKIYIRTKYATNVARCKRCGGDGTYETSTKVRKYRNASEVKVYINNALKLRAKAIAARAEVESEIDSLSEKENDDGKP